MEEIKYEQLKKHQIIHLVDEQVNVIVFPVTKKDLKAGINADHEGFYGFRGLWYPGNGTRLKSYGKIYNLSLRAGCLRLVRSGIHGLSKKELRKLVR